MEQPGAQKSKTKGIDLHSEWVVYVDFCPPQAVCDSDEFSKHLVELGRFHTITGFWRFWNNIGDKKNLFAKLPTPCNIRMFKSHVKPTRDDPFNVNGGEWAAKVENEYAWLELAMAAVGESIMDSTCGIIFSRKKKENVVRVWSADPVVGEEEEIPSRIRLILNLTDDKPVTHTLHNANQEYQANGVNVEGHEPAPLSPKGTLKYENDFLRSHAITVNCKVPPKDLENVDWEKIAKDAKNYENSRLLLESRENGEEKVSALQTLDNISSDGPQPASGGLPNSSSNGGVSGAPPGPGFQDEGQQQEGVSEKKDIQKQTASLRIKIPKPPHAPTTDISAPNIEKLYPLPKVPKVKNLAPLDENGGGPEKSFNQSDIEKELEIYKDSYQIEILDSLSDELTAILDAEGCPKCLRGVDDYDGHYVILRCKMTMCSHVLHLPCVHSKDPGATPRRSRPVTSLKSYHSTTYFRNVTINPQDPDCTSIPRNPPGSRSNCSIELELSHILSDATGLRIKWPHTVSSLMDHRSGQEFLHLSLEQTSTPRQKRSSLPIFRAKRGRIIFKCTDVVQQQTFDHDMCYDISKMPPDQTALKLLLVFPHTRNSLTVGIKRAEVLPNQKDDAYVLSFVKYEFGTPVASPLVLPIPPNYQAPMSPLTPMRSPVGVVAISPMVIGNSRIPGLRFPFHPSTTIPAVSPLVASTGSIDGRGQPQLPPLSPLHNPQHPATSPNANGVRKMNHQTSFPTQGYSPVFNLYPNLSHQDNLQRGVPTHFAPDSPSNNEFFSGPHHFFAGSSAPGGISMISPGVQSNAEHSTTSSTTVVTKKASGTSKGGTGPSSGSKSANSSGGPQSPKRFSRNKSRFGFCQDTPRSVVPEEDPYSMDFSGGFRGLPAPVAIPPGSTSSSQPGVAGPSQLSNYRYSGAQGEGVPQHPPEMVPALAPPLSSGENGAHPPTGPHLQQQMYNRSHSHDSFLMTPSDFGASAASSVGLNPLNSQLLGAAAGIQQTSASSTSVGGSAPSDLSGATGWQQQQVVSMQNHSASTNYKTYYSPSMHGSSHSMNVFQDYGSSTRHTQSYQNIRNPPISRTSPGMGPMSTGISAPMNMPSNGGLLPPTTSSIGVPPSASSGGGTTGGSGGAHPTPVSHGQGPPQSDIMDHIRGRVFMLSKSQSGSRFVQDKLSDPVYFSLFFDELKVKVAELMMDNFGHYAIEALLNGCNDEQRLILVMNLSAQIGTVACHKQGSFSIQAMMDTLRSQTQIQCLCDALSKDIVRIILNCSGHYVILRFLQRFGYPYTQFIHQAICEHTIEFATDHYGLRVLKAVADAGPAADIRDVFNSLVKYTNQLVENQYGNYIIQHLLEGAPKNVQEAIKQKMNGKFVRFAKQKFSSNVVERCLRNSGNNWRQIVIRQLLASAGELISDKYGNYCLQTALQACDRQMVAEFTAAVTPHLGTLRENVKVKWKKILDAANKKHSHTPLPPVL